MASSGPWACNCLNLRIHKQSDPEIAPTALTSSAEYIPVFVGTDGITVLHPQLTLRTRSETVPIPDTSQYARHTTLSCLICHSLVYRVYQIVSPSVEATEGPLLPTDDWVEHDVLQSANGWIEVHTGCLVGDAISQAASSPLYSSSFGISLPSSSVSPTSSIPSSPSQLQQLAIPLTPPLEEPIRYFANLRPLFPPPPFTPTHPIFSHISSIASKQSQDIRNAAEEEIAKIVKAKHDEIEAGEQRLRREVEILWRSFRKGMDKFDRREKSPGKSPARKEGDSWPVANVSSATGGGPVSIRDFVPVTMSHVRDPVAVSIPRISTLSASLATSAFHYPRERVNTPEHEINSHSPPPYSPRSSSSGLSSLSSVSTRSDGPGNILKPFQRNMDQSKDTAASFRYFSVLESEMARVAAKRQEEALQNTTHTEGQTSAAEPINGSRTSRGEASQTRNRRERSTSKGRAFQNKQEPTNGQENGKGKRKVTFDIKPDVVTIKREMNAEKEEAEAESVNQNNEEMIFDLEDDGTERVAPDASPNPVYQLIEHAQAPPRPPRGRTLNNTAGLPMSFSALRPASLPAPSSIRPRRPESESETKKPAEGIIKPDRHHRASTPPRTMDDEIIDPREAEILKLLAANTPSHRGAWKKDSKAWRTFLSRQDQKLSAFEDCLMEEETEEDESDPLESDDSTSDDYKSMSLVSSLPISVGPLGRKEPLSLSSYQPKSTLSDRPGTFVPPLPTSLSSVALRKAAYAERDRNRSRDPGALDFAAEDEEYDESDHEDLEVAEVEVGGRGRQRAFKILQKRSELPAAGMWRSLA